MWSSSLIMTERVSSPFTTRPLPAFLAACSRLMRCFSTRSCLSRGVRVSIATETLAGRMVERSATAGWIVSRSFRRSAFLSQPGNGKSFTLRARRTRLVMTMPDSFSEDGAAGEWPFSAFILKKITRERGGWQRDARRCGLTKRITLGTMEGWQLPGQRNMR